MSERLVSKSQIMVMSDPHDARILAFTKGLRKVRAFRNMNQTELSALVGISQPQYSMIETGRYEPMPALVFLLEKHLRCAPGALSFFLGYVPNDEGDSDD